MRQVVEEEKPLAGQDRSTRPSRHRAVWGRLAAWAGATAYERTTTVLHLLSLVVAFVFLAVIDRHAWFGADDFDFLAQRGLHGAARSIWVGHNSQWSTLPILVWRALFSIFGLRTAQPYLYVLFVFHLALAHLLWRVMRRMYVEPLIATTLAAIFCVLGSGAENIVWAFQIGFVGALALGWGYVALVNHEGPLGRRDLAAGALSIAALMFSGVSVTMVAVGGLVALARRGPRAALLAVAPAAAVFLVWLALVEVPTRQEELHTSFTTTVLAVPAYVFTGIANAGERAVDASAFGAVLLVGLAFWALRKGPGLTPTPAAPALAGMVGALVFFVIAAFGRSYHGVMEATSVRYVYVSVALLLPAAGLALSSLAARRRGRLVVLTCLLTLVGVANIGQLLAFRTAFVARSLQAERQIIAAAAIARSGAVIPGSFPAGNLHVVNLTVEMVVRFANEGLLPAIVHPTLRDDLVTATLIQLGLTHLPLYRTASSAVFVSSPVPVVVTRAGCRIARSARPGAAFVLGIEQPASIRLYSARGGSVLTMLRLPGVGSVRRTLMLAAGRVIYLDVAAAPASVAVEVPLGTSLRVC